MLFIILLEIIGNLISIGVNTVSSIDIYHMYKTKENVDKFPYLMFIPFILNNFFWTIYGFKLDSLPIIACSLYGYIANNIYLVFYILSTTLAKNTQHNLIAIQIISQILLYTIINSFSPDPSFYGFIASSFSILTVISTIQKIYYAMTKKDNSYIAIKVVSVIFCSSCIWFTIGTQLDYNIYIMIPNSIGIVICGFQIYLYKKLSKQGNSISKQENKNWKQENLIEKNDFAVVKKSKSNVEKFHDFILSYAHK